MFSKRNLMFSKRNVYFAAEIHNQILENQGLYRNKVDF